MMNLNITVNGKQIAYIDILNTGYTNAGFVFYEANLQDDEYPNSRVVRVSHKPRDGYKVLIKKVMEELSK